MRRVQLNTKVLPELKAHIERRAAQEGRSVSNMLERIIEQDKNKGK